MPTAQRFESHPPTPVCSFIFTPGLGRHGSRLALGHESRQAYQPRMLEPANHVAVANASCSIVSHRLLQKQMNWLAEGGAFEWVSRLSCGKQIAKESRTLVP